MKTLYLHIGLHKTGSTSLQSALFENLDLLKARGYLLPEAGRSPRAEEKIIHSNISHDIRQARAFAPGAGGLAEVLHEIRRALERGAAEKIAEVVRAIVSEALDLPIHTVESAAEGLLDSTPMHRFHPLLVLPG